MLERVDVSTVVHVRNGAAFDVVLPSSGKKRSFVHLRFSFGLSPAVVMFGRPDEMIELGETLLHAGQSWSERDE